MFACCSSSALRRVNAGTDNPTKVFAACNPIPGLIVPWLAAPPDGGLMPSRRLLFTFTYQTAKGCQRVSREKKRNSGCSSWSPALNKRLLEERTDVPVP